MTLTRMLLVCGVFAAGCQRGEGGDDDGTDSSMDGSATDPTESEEDTGPTTTVDPTHSSDPTMDPTMDPTGDSSDDACDPGGCQKYCDWARCLFADDIDGAKCLDACNTNCGDGSFESSDRDLLTCQAKVSSDFNCADSQACCAEVFTNQICPD